MKFKIIFLQITVSVFCMPLFLAAALCKGEKIVTDTSAFIFVGNFNDSMVHIVWDRYKQITNATYTVEKSIDNGVNFIEVKSIIDDNALADLKNINNSLINRYENILYTTEGGYMRFIYRSCLKSHFMGIYKKSFFDKTPIVSKY